MRRETRHLSTVALLFFMSGIAGLTYEVVWARLLERVMGASVYSITTVLTVFMAGLALGSFVAGKVIDRRSDPLRIYGILEGAIGIYCLLVPAIITATIPLYRAAYQSAGASFQALSIVRFTISALVLIVPTTLMGATLPVLSKYFTTRYDHLGRSVGQLYALNTFGAVAGSFLAGFVLMPLLGIMGTIVVAAAVNLIVASIVVFLHRRERRSSAAPATAGGKKRQKERRAKKARAELAGSAPAGRDSAPSDRVLAFVLVAFALSGFAAMVYQVSWMRTLSLVVGSSVYAVSITLVAYILGLALGAQVFSRIVDRNRDLLLTLGGLEIAIGAAALAVVPILGRLPVVMVGVIENYSASFGALMTAQFMLVFLVILAPTILLGGVFPTVVKLFTKRVETVGRSVGDVYAANTVGAIAGSFAGGFLLIPWLGIQGSIAVAVTVNVALGAALALGSPVAARVRKVVAGVIAAGVLLFFLPLTPDWDPVIMSSGAYLYGDMYARQAQSWHMSREEVIRLFGKILYHEEGVATTVTVRQAGSEIYLQANGKTEASTGPDMKTQKLLAHVPMMLHPDPENVLVIGLASGVTVGAAQTYPIAQIDCVEIAPAMIDVADRFFGDVNGRCLEDPRLNIIIEDGRNHVAFTSTKYDVMISQPSNPWIAGISNLFTLEFFELARDSLRPGGVVGLWFQAYSMSADDLRMVVRTFAEVFEHVSIWELDPGVDYMLVGTVGEMRLDYGLLRERLADSSIGADLASIGVESPLDYAGLFVLNENTLPAYVGGAPIHTDNGLALEFSAPKSMYRHSLGEQLLAFAPHRGDPTSIVTDLPEGEEGETVRAAFRSRSLARAQLAVGLAHEEAGDEDGALAAYERAREASPGEPEVASAIARLLCQKGAGAARENRTEEATAYYLAAAEAAPSLPQPHCLLGASYLRLGRVDEARDELARALEIDPDYADAHFNMALLYERLGMAHERLAALERYLENAPTASNVDRVRAEIARLESQLGPDASREKGRR